MNQKLQDIIKERDGLKQENKQRNAELSIISSVGEAMSKRLDIETVTKIVGDKIKSIFNTEVTEILLLDEESQIIQVPYSFYRDYEKVAPFKLGEGLTSKVINSRTPLFLSTLEEQKANGAIFDEGVGEADNTSSYLGVPIIRGDNVVGVVSLQSYNENAFTEDNSRLLSTLSTSMAIALENAKLFQETEELLNSTEQRNAELAVINSVQEGLVAQMDIQSIYDLVGEKIQKIFDAQVVSIGKYDHQDGQCYFKYDIEKGERFYDKPRKFNVIDEYLISTKKRLIINTNFLDELKKLGGENLSPAEGTEIPKSAIWVPLIVGETVTGYVSLQNVDRENAFGKSEIQLLNTLASSMSVALENARLFDETTLLLEETKQQAIELQIINSVGEGLAERLDFQSIVDLVGAKIKEVFAAKVVSISTYDPELDEIHHRYAIENSERFYFDNPQGIDPDRKEIVESKAPLVFGTAAEMIEHSGEGVVVGGMPESYMGVPIILNQIVTGIITVQDLEQQNLYDEKDVRLLMTLASNMGVALENARLFEETSRLLDETQQRNTELSILNAIQEGLVMEMDFEAIINLVGNKLREALGFLDLGIRLYDRENDILKFPYEYEHGERLEIKDMPPTLVSRYVLESGQMLLIRDNIDQRLAELGGQGVALIPGTDQSKSLVAVPIMLGSVAKGLIIIENYEKENAYSESDIRLLTTLANSMSVALENARLFDETTRLLKDSEKRTAELATVNSISRAIVGHLNIDQLIKMVGESTKEQFNASIVYVALLDEETGMINFPYGYGDEFPPLKLGEGLTSKIINTGKPLLMNKEVDLKTEELGVARIGLPSASYLGVPIPIGEKNIGVLSVQSTEEENNFTEDDLRLLNTIASHVGIAFNNANAYNELNRILENLKSTQDQLIAQEKLASLGQLTAGIAHEIKNPLNFVNNFSELSIGLVEELQEEFDKYKSKFGHEALEELNEILATLKQNSEKITEHGKRADSIVHSMLQHSRGKTADEKQPTDLNAMLDEDLNLVYHGLRAQDSSFNIKIEKEYDEKISTVNVIPQDMSRVFLNILTNGCYEAHRKKIELVSEEPAIIKVKTSENDKFIEISVRDNGFGIPDEIKDNLFTPFFTTKPAGKGTGLGLSISYDIVVREHQGELMFNTQEGLYTEFIIRLPKKMKK